MSVFLAFTSMLSGNVTTILNTGGFPANNYQMELVDTSSKILQTGLVACDEFVTTYWNNNAILKGLKPIENPNGTTTEWDKPMLWNNYSNTDPYAASQYHNRTLTADLFQNPAGLCRNGTLLTAIEDLANNITISMLTSPNLV